MNPLIADTLPMLLGLVVKGTLLLVAAWAVCLLLRQASAATRHLVWAAAIAGVLLLPILSLSLPRWNVVWNHRTTPSIYKLAPSTGSPVAAPAASPETTKNEAPVASVKPSASATEQAKEPDAAVTLIKSPPFPIKSIAVPKAYSSHPSPLFLFPLLCAALGTAVWLAGFLAVLIQFLIGLRHIGQIGRQAESLEGATLAIAQEARQHLGIRPVAFLRANAGSGVTVPVTWGLFRPVVLLPAQSSSWSEECLRAALLHELAHVQRWDWLTQVAARLACALYWWHPLVWWAAKQARAESERACDDLVLGTGMKAADYAQRLVEVVRSLPEAAPSRTVAIAMAQPSEVEGRVKAVLAMGTKRGAITHKAFVLVGIMLGSVLLPLAALRPMARAQGASPVAGAQPKRETIAPKSAEDYSNFGTLPDAQKAQIVWQLFDKHQFGKPEQKPICRDLLATQGTYCNANATSFTSSALTLAQTQDWKDLRDVVTEVYKKPTSIWLYQGAFQCLRTFDAKPISTDIITAADTLRLSGYYRSPTTPEEIRSAQQQLREAPDKEAVLVYCIYVAGWHSGKGGNERGRTAAADVLGTLDQGTVHSTLFTLRDNFDEVGRPEIEWIIRYLKLGPH